MPSPVPERPGLLIRDPHQYSDTTLIIPPQLVECLRYFNGELTDLDLRAHLVRMTGSLQVGDLEQHLISTLHRAGFLEDDLFDRLRRERQQRFAAAAVREASHAGSAYPAEPAELRETLQRYIDTAASGPATGNLFGIAAPHISPEGGGRAYGAAYRALDSRCQDRVFVILGTSHYGAPARFGLTRKPFLTPLGEARTETSLVDRLARHAPAAVTMEDYCHATEHSIEFQVIFLQHRFGPGVRILPILCGSYIGSLLDNRRPEDDDAVKAFIAALGELAASENENLFWVLGVDMAHMGRRYGDSFPAVADEGVMREVAERDHRRIARIAEWDADGFWELVREKQDDLKWCGASAFYTLMRAIPDRRGRLLHYEQWNIDEQSVVSFGAISFFS